MRHRTKRLLCCFCWTVRVPPPVPSARNMVESWVLLANGVWTKRQRGVSSYATFWQRPTWKWFSFWWLFFYDVTKLLLQVRTAQGDAGRMNAVLSVCVWLREHGSIYVMLCEVRGRILPAPLAGFYVPMLLDPEFPNPSSEPNWRRGGLENGCSD